MQTWYHSFAPELYTQKTVKATEECMCTVLLLEHHENNTIGCSTKSTQIELCYKNEMKIKTTRCTIFKIWDWKASENLYSKVFQE